MAFILFLCDAHLVLRSSVLTVLNEVNVTLKNAETFGREDLLMAGGAVEVLLVFLSCPLLLLRPHPLHC